MEKEELLQEILKYIRVRDLVSDVVFDRLIFVKLDELVASTENSLDDGLAQMIKPVIKDYALDQLDKLLAQPE